MNQKDIDRINALYHKSKSVGLTEEEKAEQQKLRQDYIAAVRANLRGSLESIKIQNPDGSIIDVKAEHDKNTDLHNVTKKELRSEMKACRLALTEDERVRHAANIKEKLLALPEYKEAACIYGYLATQGELSVTEVLKQALADGKRVALPRVAGKEIQFYYVTDIENDTEVGSFSILEPKTYCEKAVELAALILVPGVAFSYAGARLGYGGGFYDRFLARNPGHFFAVGVSYDFQLVDSLPQESHDIRLHTILPSNPF